MFCNILAYLLPLMSLSVENTTWKDACTVTIRIAKGELLWRSGWKWGRQGFIIVLLLQVRNSRHLKINKWASIVFTLLGFLPTTGKTFQMIGRNWNEFGKHMPSVEARLPDHLEAVRSCLGLLGSRVPQGGVEGSPPQGSLYCSSVPPPVLFIAESLIVRDRRSKHKILLSSLLGPLSKFLSPLASRPGS